MIALVLAAAVSTPLTIRQTVQQEHGPATQVTRVMVHGDYALSAARSGGAQFFDGLQFSHGTWRVVCTQRSEPLPPHLQSACGFPQAVAVELSANEATQSAVERGQFNLATIAQVRAYNFSARGTDRDQERARLQLLHQLSEQMRTGRITRAQAIQQWNQFRYSWMLP